jgi:D-alanyl-D-alanine carboxypeptidase/D-alanyl-D-alanine-endopeptidase (penicillin-binding protein 4)
VGAYRIADQPNVLVVRGDCRREQGFTVAIEKPAVFFGFMLAESLARADISVKGQLIEKGFDPQQPWQSLAEFKTPLTDCLSRCNKDSLQLAAEALLKTLAAQAMPGRKGGGWLAGQAILGEFLKGLGIPEEAFVIDDACGLSRENRLTARSLTTVLRAMYESEFWEIYKDSLSIGGIDGTLRKSFREPEYKGKVRGKTGYISKVKSFSGACLTDNGTYLFSILTYNAKGPTRNAINQIAQAIIDSNE